jgi:hypothetical protein
MTRPSSPPAGPLSPDDRRAANPLQQLLLELRAEQHAPPPPRKTNPPAPDHPATIRARLLVLHDIAYRRRR